MGTSFVVVLLAAFCVALGWHFGEHERRRKDRRIEELEQKLVDATQAQVRWRPLWDPCYVGNQQKTTSPYWHINGTGSTGDFGTNVIRTDRKMITDFEMTGAL